MKQKDIALILVVVVMSGVLSLFVARLLFTPPKNRQQKVEVVDAITTDFLHPDSQYFNATSINPTQLIRISENANPAPFKGQ